MPRRGVTDTARIGEMIERRVRRHEAPQPPAVSPSPGALGKEAQVGAGAGAGVDAAEEAIYEGEWEFDLPVGARREVVIPHTALTERWWTEFSAVDADTGLEVENMRVTPVSIVSDGTYDDGSVLLALVEDLTPSPSA